MGLQGLGFWSVKVCSRVAAVSGFCRGLQREVWVGFLAGVGLVWVWEWFWVLLGIGLSFGNVGKVDLLIEILDSRYSLLGVNAVEPRPWVWEVSTWAGFGLGLTVGCRFGLDVLVVVLRPKSIVFNKMSLPSTLVNSFQTLGLVGGLFLVGFGFVGWVVGFWEWGVMGASFLHSLGAFGGVSRFEISSGSSNFLLGLLVCSKFLKRFAMFGLIKPGLVGKHLGLVGLVLAAGRGGGGFGAGPSS